ncbi:hypothetical protein DEJ33_10110 [Curtobacterium sp. MCPF17_047]|uniref:BLUF domain-containing protein n=1 Tax=unclassified Curtobacterium TaxID=257496 RepID=UPI000DA9CE86|nr:MULTISPECIES: BLUF domain-containing protein [unclassified Curtobacterium]PZE62827.1 hypothetical protein DEJ24_00685 [Curtobacterium sp. MCPF17_001]PZF65613.1 hypothetical protein DEJ33_10110 [Curtobacterium sp. MCPF17_047]
MLSLIYSSVATDTFDDAELAALLSQSRTANERNDVTGMLLFRNGYFLQVLEGPDAAVRSKMATIKTDPRHTKVTMLLEDIIEERQFPAWTMAFAPTSATDLEDVPGYRATFDDVESISTETPAPDAVPSNASPALRELIRWFQARPDRFRTAG